MFEGYTHNAATTRKQETPWDLSPSLISLSDWEAIGYGNEPPMKLQLSPMGLVSNPKGEEYQRYGPPRYILTELRALTLFREALQGSKFDVKQIYAIKNEALAQSFNSEMQKLQHKFTDAPSLFNAQGWRENDNNGQGSKEMRLKEKTFEQLKEFANGFEWNKNRKVKIIPVVHGTSVSSVWKVCSSGFTSLATLNEGWYGKYVFLKSWLTFVGECTFLRMLITQQPILETVRSLIREAMMDNQRIKNRSLWYL